MNNSYFKVGQNISDVIKALLFNNVLLLIAYLIIFRFLPHTLEVQIVLLLLFLYIFVFTILSYGHKKRLIISKSGFLILHKQGKDVLYERYPWSNINSLHYVVARGTRHKSSSSLTISMRKHAYSSRKRDLYNSKDIDISINLDEFFHFSFKNAMYGIARGYYDYQLHNVLTELCKKYHVAYKLYTL